MNFCIEFCSLHRGRIHRQPKRLIFEQNYQCVIGPNGFGKSTILSAIARCEDCRRSMTDLPVCYYDGERMNPHVDPERYTGVTGSRIAIRSRYSSHGETLRDVIRCLPVHPSTPALYLFDEPETGHDLFWLRRLKKALRWLGKQAGLVIVASHHPVFWAHDPVIELAHGYRRKMMRAWLDVLRPSKETP